MAGRTVKIYLKEGTPNSLLIAEIFNWTGKVFVIPRSQLIQIADRAEIKQTGIYVLVGQDLEDSTYFGRIPGFKGVWANQLTKQECREELRGVLEEWTLLNIADHTPLPVI